MSRSHKALELLLPTAHTAITEGLMHSHGDGSCTRLKKACSRESDELTLLSLIQRRLKLLRRVQMGLL